jgi:hypothetical protein
MKAYTGRIAFDPDTETHREMIPGKVNVPVQLDDGTWGNTTEDSLVPGELVVTDDGGKTWRYAEDGDPSHNSRYQEQVVGVDSTANQLLELSLEHGADRAAELVDAHHFEVQPDDPHFGGVKFDPDPVAETITGHTDAYAEAKS